MRWTDAAHCVPRLPRIWRHEVRGQCGTCGGAVRAVAGMSAKRRPRGSASPSPKPSQINEQPKIERVKEKQILSGHRTRYESTCGDLLGAIAAKGGEPGQPSSYLHHGRT